MRLSKIMDGNAAAAYVAYAYSELAAIYPITPSSPMAEQVDDWAAAGKRNLFGAPVSVTEMQSEGGAAGVLHGALSAGALAATFTSSQGLLLMLPNLYKIAGERLPAVVYVAARSIATHALSIFGDHSDVYAARPAGLALLALSSVQEIMDLAPVAHKAALCGRIPFMPFFDGFRTSHELQKIEVWSEEQLRSLYDFDALHRFKQRALSPNHPVLRGSAENSDLFFQHREASNSAYNALPDIVEAAMEKVNALIDSDYHLFSYYGDPQADRVIVGMGSVCEAGRETVENFCRKGEKVGFLQVRLFHPFDQKRFLAALPQTCRRLAVLDRGKEPGAVGEPLYLEVSAALSRSGRAVEVLGGRYGLGSKDTSPSALAACYSNLASQHPVSPFTLGIIDDVTHLSLAPLPPDCAPTEKVQSDGGQAADFAAICWGIGGDGSVSALKSVAKLLGKQEGRFIQAFFRYDSKKTGGVTVGQLRTAASPIHASYDIDSADIVLCGQLGYLKNDFPIVEPLKKGGVLLIATDFSAEQTLDRLAVPIKRRLAEKQAEIWLLPARSIAENCELGGKIGTVLGSALLFASGLLPPAEAEKEYCTLSAAAYAKSGGKAAERTQSAIRTTFALLQNAPNERTAALAVQKLTAPENWGDLPDEPSVKDSSPDYVQRILRPVSRMRGDELPVSALLPYDDGSLPAGTSAYEKRGIAEKISSWSPGLCIQCGRCSFVCPHAAIRAFALSAEERAAAPEGMKFADRPVLPAAKGSSDEALSFAIVISPADCTGCTLCTKICPTQALSMKKREDEAENQAIFQYAAEKVSEKTLPWGKSVKGVQFNRPLLEFSGACAGCAQASYARLVTQLFGRRMIISNATGCSSIWGGSAPVSPYTTHPADGRGPAWANSLFEDNAEHGLGIYLAHKAARLEVAAKLTLLQSKWSEAEGAEALTAAIQDYLDSFHNDAHVNQSAADRLVQALKTAEESAGEKSVGGEAVGQKGEKSTVRSGSATPALIREILSRKDALTPKSVWLFGGDGWAYDIGLGGLLHVLSSGENVNVLVFDTEVYSNTGGQASGASRIGQVARFAGKGRVLGKKSLSEIVLTLGSVYVAQIAMGADLQQTLNALTEAEAYPGPSLVLAYSPCELHGIGGGMGESQNQMKRAVECGYVTLFRYQPPQFKAAQEKDGEKEASDAVHESPVGRLILDSAPPKGDFRAFLLSENRYARLIRENPEQAEALLTSAQQAAWAHRRRLELLAEQTAAKH